jgi:hypothetical protein
MMQSKKDNDKGKTSENPGGSRTTRGTEVEGGMNREEIEALPGQEVTDAQKGMRYLESTLLMIPGTPYTTGALVTALFQILMPPGIKTSRMNTNAR